MKKIILLLSLLCAYVHILQAQTPENEAQTDSFAIRIETVKTPFGFKAVNDTFTVRTDATQLFNILRNDETDTFDIVNFTIIEPAQGDAKVKNDRGVDKLQYTRVNDGTDTDQLTYQICLPSGECRTGKVIIYKCPAGALGFPEVSVTTVRVNDILTYAHTGNRVRLSTMPKYGEIFMNADSSGFSYSPKPDFTGADAIKYDVYEISSAACGQIRLEGHDEIVQVIPLDKNNQKPIAEDDEISIEGSKKTEIFVLVNDSDPEGNLRKKITVETSAQHGKMRYSPQSITYTPAEGYVGTEKITYSVCDYNGACDRGTVIITVKKAQE